MKLKATPPKPPSEEDKDERIAAIISGATAASPSQSPPQPVVRHVIATPWKDSHVRQDLTVQLNARIPEALSIKLRQVAHLSDRQKQDLVVEALELLLNAKLLELGYGKDDL